MAWNPDGGGDRGPWGQGPQPPQPPDMDKVLKMAKEKFGGGGNSAMWLVVLLVIMALWIYKCIYVVGPDEQGVVKRFGRYVETTKPGPHFLLFPIESVEKPKVTQIQRIEIGFRSRGRGVLDVPIESLMLTGDENIIDIDLTVQYRIKNARDFLFEVRDSAFADDDIRMRRSRFSMRRAISNDKNNTVRTATESAIRQVIGHNSIDTALTTGKDKIQSDTKVLIQSILDDYKAGIEISSVQLQQVAPPEEVVHAFKDVASAREDRERAINEAQGYKNDILPKAKGEAEKRIQEAEAYRASKVANAKGDAKRFDALLTAYEESKSVTATRLYLETMEQVLMDANKVLVDRNVSQGMVPYLPLAPQALTSGQRQQGGNQ
ncbi:FtsH protease activity modulator HflK [Magnetococcales bacterium HHB-1]